MVEHGRRLCTILSRLHQEFTHRDLSPDVIVISENRVQLTDYGFSFMPPGIEHEVGSYRAPEQSAKGSAEIGCWTDIYSLGMILGEMLSGESHYFHQGGNLAGTPKRLNLSRDIPGELKEVVVQCTQERVSCRPKTIEEICRKLSAWLLIYKGVEAAHASGVTNYSGAGSSPVALQGGGCSIVQSTNNRVLSDEKMGLDDQLSRQETAVTAEGSGLLRAGWLTHNSAALMAAWLRVAARQCRKVFRVVLTSALTIGRGVRRLSAKKGTWAMVALIVAMQTELWNVVQPSSHLALAPQTKIVWVGTEAVAEWQAQSKQLTLVLREFDLLVYDYRNAKVPGSAEKTAQNFRSIERKAIKLRAELAGSATIHKSLNDITALEIKMIDYFAGAADLFAGYLEGIRRTTEYVDWVDEANDQYWQAVQARSQVAERLSAVKPPRRVRAVQ